MFLGTDPQDGSAAGGSAETEQGARPPKPTPIEAATLDYLRAGFVPIPIARGRKKAPCFAWSTTYGYDRASGTLKHPPSEADVRAWKSKYPGYNVALLTGRAGGFDVIDPDMKPGQNGMGALAELEAALGALPDGPTQVTPNGGRHFLYRPAARSFPIGGKVTQLADDVDTRLDGNYIVVAPSVLLEEQEEDGRWVKLPEPRYWTWDLAHPPLRQDTLPELPKAWQERLLALKDGGKNGEPAPSPEIGGAIPLHQRNSNLTSRAGTMRRCGMSEQAIVAALQIVNVEQCIPPLPEGEVRAIAHSVGRYAPASPTPDPEPSAWEKAVDVVDFLSAKDQGAVWIKKNIAARQVLTEIYSPRGIGKTNITYAFAKECVNAGFRVLLLDRDNPPFEIRRRMRHWGLATIPKGRFRVMTRNEVPRLTDAAAWASFPIEAYDLMIVDALDSTAEGVGEQDSKQPSKAVAVLLDIIRRENGPGVITLGNTVRTGKHSRGSGVVEDRGDIVYEVRDATGFKPTGEKDWWSELPKGSAEDWADRASRRRGQNVFRLAFGQSKFRVDKEPEPFVLEMDLSGERWSYRDVTAELLATVGQTVEAQQRAKLRRIEEAVLALQVAIRQAVADGKPLKKGDAETALIQASGSPKISQAEARSILTKGNLATWRIKNGPGKGSPLCLFPLEVDMTNEEKKGMKETNENPHSSMSSSFFVDPKHGDVPATKKEKQARQRLRGTAKVVPIRGPAAPSTIPAPSNPNPDDPANDCEPWSGEPGYAP